MTPKTFEQLMVAILSVCPQAELDEMDGHIIVWTGFKEDEDGNLSEFTDEDSEESDVEDKEENEGDE